jgi:hypothetical protein
MRTRMATSTGSLSLRLLVAAGLAVDAYVHFHLAAQFDPIVGSGSPHVSEGQLFRAEGAVAAIAAVLVLFVDRQVTVLLAFLVAAAGTAAVLLYAVVDIGAHGPFPDMYDARWYTEKKVSLIAEAIATVAAAALLLRRRRLAKS